MKYELIALFVVIGVCYGDGNLVNTTQAPILHNSSVHININGKNTEAIPKSSVEISLPPGPSINNSTEVPTTTSSSDTTVKPNVTTSAPNTSTTMSTTSIKPTSNPNVTTSTEPPRPTTSTPAANSTTPKPTLAPTSSTKVPPASTQPPAPSSHRKFDGPSFVGGIVLASGLMAIGFVAFKFYKARTELNYHTL